MIKNKILPILLLGFLFSLSVLNISAQQNFNSFWKKFRTAVARNDRKAVTNLTSFPIADSGESEGNPYSRTKFLKNYGEIFNGFKSCIQKPPFRRIRKTIVNVDCSGRTFTFTKTKSGWKFTEFSSY